jgi:mortality factor 4-like protein 1
MSGEASTSDAGSSKTAKTSTAKGTLTTLHSTATNQQWKINEKCLCYHGPLIYEGIWNGFRAEI